MRDHLLGFTLPLPTLGEKVKSEVLPTEAYLKAQVKKLENFIFERQTDRPSHPPLGIYLITRKHWPEGSQEFAATNGMGHWTASAYTAYSLFGKELLYHSVTTGTEVTIIRPATREELIGVK